MRIKYSIRKKFMMVSLVTGIGLVAIQLILLLMILRNIHESDVKYSADMVAQMNLAIDKSFQGIRSLAYHMSMGKNIENYLMPENDFDLYQNHQYFKQTVNTMILCDEHILDIALYRSDSRITYHYLKDDEELNEVIACNRDYFERQPQIPSFQVIYNERRDISYTVYVQPVKFLSRTTTHWNEQLGCLLIFLDKNLINNILEERDTDIVSSVCLLDEQDRIVTSIGLKDREDITDLRTEPISDTGWKIGYVLNDRTVFKRYGTLRYMIVAAIVVAISLFWVSFLACNHYIIRPISDLYHQIEFVTSGGMKKRIHMNREDEIGSIAQVINNMLNHQTEISYRMLYTQQELYEKELKEKENELRILENQVNPHFILNTLQCICGIAVIYDVQEVIDIATAMGEIFKYSLRAPETVTLRRELEIVEQYLSIVDIRFNHHFQWDVDVPEEFLNIEMPKMILQPLVENAVYHGLEKKGAGSVRLFCDREKESILIHIWDDGAGMEESKQEEIKRLLADGEALYRVSMEVKRIGIANTCLRIKNYFGNSYGIEIDSTEGSGTDIALRIPGERMEKQVDFDRNMDCLLHVSTE